MNLPVIDGYVLKIIAGVVSGILITEYITSLINGYHIPGYAGFVLGIGIAIWLANGGK